MSLIKHEKKNRFVCALQAFLSTCAILLDTAYIGMDYMPYFQSEILYKDIESFVLFTLLYIVYRKKGSFHEDTKKLRLLAFFFAMVVFIGRAYLLRAQAYTVLFSSLLQFIISVSLIYGLFCIIHYVLGMFYEKIYYSIESKGTGHLFILYKITDRWLYVFLFIFLCWLPYWIIFFPGGNSYDTGVALYLYFDRGIIGNARPAFLLYLIMVPLKLSKMLFGSYTTGYAFCSLVQMTALAGVITYGIFILKRYSVSAIYRLVLMLFFSFVPLFPLDAITLGPDIPFAALMLLYSIFWVKMYYDKRIDTKWAGILLTVLVLSCLYRHQGIYILFVGLIMSVIMIILRKKAYTIVALIHAISIVLILIYNSCILPNIITRENEVTASNTQTIMSLVLVQQFAEWYCEYGDELKFADQNSLGRFVEFETIKENYNPDISDPVMKSFDYENMTSEDWKVFYHIWLKCGMRHPAPYIRATINMTYGYLYPNYRSKAGKGSVDIGWEFVEESPELQIIHPESLAPLRKIVTYYWRWLFNTPVTGIFFNSGIYTWMLLFAISIIFIRKYNKELLLVLFPPLINLAVCFASPVNGSVRYALPIIFSMPVLFGLFTVKYDDKMLSR